MSPEQTQVPELHPEDQALREEIARLRASLTLLLLQKDDLLLVQNRRIEAAYLRRFGALELKVYESWCDCLRAKRKARLLRAGVNRREREDPERIERQLDEELAEYREKLEERFQKVAGVMEKREGPGLSAGGQKELKTLFRQAVKALHPDLHPNESLQHAELLHQAMRAYRSGDLNGLRAVCDAMEPVGERQCDTLEELRAELRRLRMNLRTHDRELEQLKKSYPYSARVYLEDEERGRAREAELTEQLRALRARTARYEEEIAALTAPEEEEEGL